MTNIITALTIAGSDTVAGAGIQADLKIFSLFGIYGTTVITAITAQNTKSIDKIYPLDIMVKSQLNSVLSDIVPDSIKIGMVYNREIIDIIYDTIKDIDRPVVLDPIILSTTNRKLLLDSAFDEYIDKLIPISKVITPNIPEAEQLTRKKIKSVEDMRITAKLIAEHGIENVIIKGGHVKSDVITDLLLTEDGEFLTINNPSQAIGDSHGTGCSFSAALTAFIAKGISLKNAFILSNEFIRESLKHVVNVGNGIPIVNVLSHTFENSLRYKIINELQECTEKLMELENMYKLIPETQSNFVYALPFAKELKEIAAVEGRLIKVEPKVKVVSGIRFGASKHVASAVLEYMNYDILCRSAINIKFSEEIINILSSKYDISYYDRKDEPPEVKQKEGMTIKWGIKSALKRKSNAKIIYHKGDIGKEPMIMIFGYGPSEVLSTISFILDNL